MCNEWGMIWHQEYIKEEASEMVQTRDDERQH